jgi:hypothetical protein
MKKLIFVFIGMFMLSVYSCNKTITPVHQNDSTVVDTDSVVSDSATIDSMVVDSVK